jgi:YggT family protein
VPAYTRTVAISAVFTLISWLLELLVLVILIRVVISWIPGINPYSGFVRAIRAIADPILAPFRGMLPSFGGMLDISPVLAIIVLQALASVFSSLASNAYAGIPLGFIILSAVEQLLLTLVVIVGILVLLRLLLSIFHADPWHPLTRGIRAMARPFCQPFEGVVARSTTFDAAALVAFVVYVVIYVVVKVVFEQAVLPLTLGL